MVGDFGNRLVRFFIVLLIFGFGFLCLKRRYLFVIVGLGLELVVFE